jgi:hypothetical protein
MLRCESRRDRGPQQQRDKIGTIEPVMLDKVSGRIAYAAMSFGGFLGMGSEPGLAVDRVAHNPQP